MQIAQLRGGGSWIRRALDVAHVYALITLRCLKTLRGWEGRAQISTGILNKIAFFDPSSLMTVVVFEYSCTLRSPTRLGSEGKKYARGVDGLPFVPFELVFALEPFFDPPVTADDQLITQTKPLLRFTLILTRLGKNRVRPPQPFQ